MADRRVRSIVASVIAAGAFLAAATVLAPVAEASAPPAPPNCVPSTFTFTNGSDVAIPTGPATVSSNLIVSGAGTYLADVDVATVITHTFSADLDITVRSPQGTFVTLTTDNGGGNDNNFNGTLWDDDADPDGQVPYTTDTNLATDHPYANLTTATPLAPEEALAAFSGENPNGTWVLTMSDDVTGDGGLLDSWSLGLQTQSPPPHFSFASGFNTPVVPISATGTPTVSSNITISGASGYLLKPSVFLRLEHTSNDNIDMTVRSPAGTVVTLSTDNGGTNDDVFDGVFFDDDSNPGGQVPYTSNDGLVNDTVYVNGTSAGSLVPEEGFGAFIGENPNGVWTLTVSDDTAGEGGVLNEWDLQLVTGSCGVPDARVKRGSGTLLGNNIYNTTAAGQTATGSATPGHSVTYTINAQNDAFFEDSMIITGPGSSSRFTVTYRDQAGINITDGVIKGGFSTPGLAPGESYRVKMTVLVRNGTPPGATANRLITVTSHTDPARVDKVKTVTHRA